MHGKFLCLLVVVFTLPVCLGSEVKPEQSVEILSLIKKNVGPDETLDTVKLKQPKICELKPIFVYGFESDAVKEHYSKKHAKSGGRIIFTHASKPGKKLQLRISGRQMHSRFNSPEYVARLPANHDIRKALNSAEKLESLLGSATYKSTYQIEQQGNDEQIEWTEYWTQWTTTRSSDVRMIQMRVRFNLEKRSARKRIVYARLAEGLEVHGEK